MISQNNLKKSVDDSKIKYKLLKSDDEDGENNFELQNLEKNGFGKKYSPKSTLYKPDEDIYVVKISEDQSLHTIAFRYNCTLWELKRHNNLLASQDFFSLSEIKIPCPVHSYRSELLKQDGAKRLDHQAVIDHSLSITPTDDGGSGDNEQTTNANNANFFRELDSNLERVKTSVELILGRPHYEASLASSANMLDDSPPTNKSLHIVKSRPANRWRIAVILMLVILVLIVPGVCILFYLKH